MKNRIKAVAFLVLIASVTALEARTITGSVKSDKGTAIAGATVTITNADGYSESVYTDASGNFRLQSVIEGAATIRARAYGFSDAVANAAPAVHFRMQHHASEALYSQDLPASAHVVTLQWDDEKMQKDFVSQCQFCHQIGNATTRRARDEDAWESVITRMQGYGSVLTWENERVFRKVLASSFREEPVKTVLTPDVSPQLSKASVREWSFGDGSSYVHDIELGRDGLIYGVDMGSDRLWILNPKTNQIDFKQMPPNDLPLGGLFSGGVAPLGTFAAYHGPHSIVEGPDGKMYMTCSLSAEICIYDPSSEQFEFLPTGGDTIYPHTLRFDKKGILWFTFALSNQIGRLDPQTKEMKIIDLPSNGFWRWLSDAMLPTILKVSSWFGKRDLYIALSHHKTSGEGHNVLNLPYGIDIDPVDGSIWYSKLYAGIIGRVDADTLAVEEFESARRGPRRLRFDQKGVLWIPSFEEGYLMTFNTKERKFEKEYRLPTLAPDQYETPYALNVHPKTGEIWITANLSDRWFRFDPQSESFVSYPSPTRVAFMRDFIFLPDGQACTSNSNLPAASIEGGRPKIVCIDAGVQGGIPARILAGK